MKTLRYLLMVMVVALVSATAQAQPKSQFKNSQNQEAFSTQYVPTTHYVAKSTSTLMESGSSLPMAARNGVTIGANTPNDDTPTYTPGRRARKDVGGGGSVEEGDPDPDDPEEPYPVGDGVWVMMMMAAGYAGWMMLRVRARRSRGESRTCTM